MNATPADSPGAPDAGAARVHVVVTAGPTREHLDDVRFLTNASTGRMGYEIAREAARRGARVTLILGPATLPPLEGVEIVDVVSTEDLLRETRRATKDADLVVFAAAPSDWRPTRRRRGKPPREGRDFELVLRPTPDVARSLSAAQARPDPRRLRAGGRRWRAPGAHEDGRQGLRRHRPERHSRTWGAAAARSSGSRARAPWRRSSSASKPRTAREIVKRAWGCSARTAALA